MKPHNILRISNLSISFKSKKQSLVAVNKLSFELNRGEVLALVGESGSGKSTTALGLLGFRQTGPGVEFSGSIHYRNKKGEILALHQLPPKAWQQIRGREIAMIFQNPARALNPLLTCGAQLKESLQSLENLQGTALQKRMQTLLEQVQLPKAERMLNAYPHQLSGGQQQRFMIALALAGKPALLLADEPTSALDRPIEREIIALLKKLQQQLNLAMLFITHDLELVQQLADKLIVLRNGRCIEKGSTRTIFTAPSTLYTIQLINSRPPADKRLLRLPEQKDIQLLLEQHDKKWPENGTELLHKQMGLSPNAPTSAVPALPKNKTDFLVKNLSISYGQGKQYIQIVKNINFSIRQGHTLGLTGPSGSGKSSIARALLRLIPVEKGHFFHRETDLLNLPEEIWRKQCRKYQMIFQDPYSSFNPLHSIGRALTEPLLYHRLAPNKDEALQQAVAILQRVGIEENALERLPRQFSGGQRQRLAIARALLLQPELLICDECVSALDTIVQARVLNLLKELQEEYGFSCLFISHDEAVIRFMADDALMLRGPAA